MRFLILAVIFSLPCLGLPFSALAADPKNLTECQLLLTNPEKMGRRLEANLIAYARRIRIEGEQIYILDEGSKIEIAEEIDRVFGDTIRQFPELFSFYYRQLVFFLGVGVDRWSLGASHREVLRGMSLSGHTQGPESSLLGDEVVVSFNGSSDTRIHAILSVELTVHHANSKDSAIFEAAIKKAGDVVRRTHPEFGALMSKRTIDTRIDLLVLPGLFGPQVVDEFLQEIHRQLWDDSSYRHHFQRSPILKLISNGPNDHVIEVRHKPDWQR